MTHFDFIPFLCAIQHYEFDSCDSKANGILSNFIFKSFWGHSNSITEIPVEFRRGEAKAEFLKKVQRLTNIQESISVK